MANTVYNSTNYRGEFVGDLQVWLRENAEDNSQQLDRLKRNLRRAREQELTPRQQEILTLRYEQNMRVTEIARLLGLNRSTVSRTLHRAQERLRRCLQYAL